MENNFLQSKFRLPCGVTLRNRLVKAAMTERLGDSNLAATAAHAKLYAKWSDTGAGLLITGNVMIDRIHLESAGNVCFDHMNMDPLLQRWAKAATKHGNHCWVQVSHSGRQTNRFNSNRPLAPSSVQLKKMGLFGKPKEMTGDDIEDVISGFCRAGRLAKKVGFTGVQIHAAHGYLLSQFLSPHTNKRTDSWGGSIENRGRLLQAIIRKMRAELGKDFPISVKLNSSDFQKGGLTEDESLKVIKMLEKEKIDLLEISGGTYERLAFFTLNKGRNTASTKRREAYFISFAEKIREFSKIPLMVTGGFRTFNFCNKAIEKNELDLIGMARPFITDLHDIPYFLAGEISALENLIIRTGFSALDDMAEGGYYARQIIRLAKDKEVQLNLNPLWSTNFLITFEFYRSLRRRLRFQN